MPRRPEPVGLVAGSGRPPFLVAEGIREAGRRAVVVGLRGFASERLRDFADEFVWCGPARINSWLSAMKCRGVREAIMIGGVRKE